MKINDWINYLLRIQEGRWRVWPCRLSKEVKHNSRNILFKLTDRYTRRWGRSSILAAWAALTTYLKIWISQACIIRTKGFNSLPINFLEGCCWSSSTSRSSQPGDRSVMWTALPKYKPYVIKTTSQLPAFSPASSSFSKSTTFCSNFSFPEGIWSSGVTLRPYSPTWVKCGDDSNSLRTCFPVAPVAPITSADWPGVEMQG